MVFGPHGTVTGLHPVISPRGIDTGFRAEKGQQGACALRIAIYEALRLQEGPDFRVLGHTTEGVQVVLRGERFLIEPSKR